MRRRLLIAAIFLLAGAVVNVAVAWGSSLYIREINRIDSTDQPVPRELTSFWERHRPPGLGQHPARSGYTLRGFGVRKRRVVTDQRTPGQSSKPQTTVLSPQFHVKALTLTETGWPFFALQGGRWTDERTSSTTGYTVEIVGYVGLVTIDAGEQRLIPLLPIWPGFTVNTLFYAAILWLLIPGPFVLRRFIRMKRGRCVKCGYPMGEAAVCSECGKALPGRVGA